MSRKCQSALFSRRDPLNGTQRAKQTFLRKKVTLVTFLYEHIFDLMDFWVTDG